MATIVTKNSSTASAVPTTSDLVQGELAVNVTDKRIFTENASTQIVELGTNPSTITTATATVTGTLTANGTFASNNAVITGGSINSTPIGATTPSTVRGSTVTATTGFVGGLTGNVTGNLTGNVTGNVVGNLTGNVTGNVTASTGTTTLNNLVVNGTADFTNTKLTNITTPTLDSDAANKGYVDATVAAVIDSAPAALDTLNELAAALGDDANFSATVTTALATKLPLAGGTMTGAIAMGTSKITGLGDPTASQDAATKIYVDTADNLKLNLSGGTMSGAIAMGTNKITGLGDPTLAQDAATKAYTDSILGSATSAAASAAAAATSESNAATSASNAATSETNALNSANAAASSYDQFDDRYLGDKASDPTLDNDGNALLTGALYFNTTTDVMRVYNGTAWQDTALSPNSPTFTGTVTADGLVIDTNTLYVDSVNNRVGVGTTSPAAELVVANSNTHNEIRTQANATYYSGFFAQSGAGRLWGMSPDLGIAGLRFGYGTPESFTENMRIDSSGNLLVGKTAADYNNATRGNVEISGSSSAILALKAGSVNDYIYNSGSNFEILAGSGQGILFQTNGSSERMRIDTSGNVGIGTTSPSNKFHVNSGTTDTVALFQSSDSQAYIAWEDSTTSTAFRAGVLGDNFILGTSSNERMRIDASGNVGIGEAPNSNSKLQILDTAATANNYTVHMRSYQPTIVWNDISGASTDFAIQVDTSAMMFQYGDAGTGTKLASEAMRIDSSGNLLVGKTATGTTIVGSQLNSDGLITATRDANYTALFTRTTNDGDIAIFRKGSTTVGGIGTDSDDLLIHSSVTGHSGIRLALGALLPTDNSGSLNPNSINIGSATNTFKDAHFAGTVNANAFVGDGSGLTGVGGGGVKVTNFTSSGTYTKDASAKYVIIMALGGGGGGAGGKSGSGFEEGGSGGAGGGCHVVRYEASLIPSTLTVTVGASAAGGAIYTDGSVGNESKVYGSEPDEPYAQGGGGGQGKRQDMGSYGGGFLDGGPSTSANGYGGFIQSGGDPTVAFGLQGGKLPPLNSSTQGGGAAEYGGGASGGAGSGGNNYNGTKGGASYFGGGGGGGGAGKDGSSTVYTGGQGGASARPATDFSVWYGGRAGGGGAGGSTNGAAGSNGVTQKAFSIAGTGGGGGAASNPSGTGGRGGNGGYGCGGGGGGAGSTGGVGGNGGQGYVRIIEILG